MQRLLFIEAKNAFIEMGFYLDRKNFKIVYYLAIIFNSIFAEVILAFKPKYLFVNAL